MRPRSISSMVTGVCVASLGATSLGQMTLISAERRIYAWERDPSWVTRTDEQSHSGFGDWDDRVTAGGMYASQRSTIDQSHVSINAWVTDFSGGGFQGNSTSLLSLTFEVSEPMAWTLDYRFDGNPPRTYHSLTRIGSTVNLFSEIPWLMGYQFGITANGFIDSGRYSLVFDAAGSAYSSNDAATFSVAVPAPGTFALLLALPGALRRRSRHEGLLVTAHSGTVRPQS